MIADWDGDTVITSTATVAELTKCMVAYADVVSTVADVIWSSAMVEAWNSIVVVEEEPRIVMPRKAKLERRREWHRRSEAQCRQRIMQSRNRCEMQAKKSLRRRYAAKTG